MTLNKLFITIISLLLITHTANPSFSYAEPHPKTTLRVPLISNNGNRIELPDTDPIIEELIRAIIDLNTKEYWPGFLNKSTLLSEYIIELKDSNAKSINVYTNIQTGKKIAYIDYQRANIVFNPLVSEIGLYTDRVYDCSIIIMLLFDKKQNSYYRLEGHLEYTNKNVLNLLSYLKDNEMFPIKIIFCHSLGFDSFIVESAIRKFCELKIIPRKRKNSEISALATDTGWIIYDKKHSKVLGYELWKEVIENLLSGHQDLSSQI